MNTAIELQIFNRLLELESPTSREHLQQQILSILGGAFVKKIDTHNTASVIFIFQERGNLFVLKTEYGTNNATHQEIKWYKKCSPHENTPRFISSAVHGNYCLLLLEFLVGAQTLEEIATNSEFNSDEFNNYVRKALVLDRSFFESSNPRDVALKEVGQFYIRRYERRLHESKRYSYLSRLLESKSISLNHKNYRSPSYYINRIEKSPDVKEYLMPKKLGLIHGDLHAGNILVRGSELFVIDPNGNLEMPIEYDYGKLLHTFHGGYTAIMRGLFIFEQHKDTYFLKIEENKVYKNATDCLSKELNDREYASALYSEVMHFASMLPHHAKNKTETTVLFLRTIDLFEELFNNMGIK